MNGSGQGVKDINDMNNYKFGSTPKEKVILYVTTVLFMIYLFFSSIFRGIKDIIVGGLVFYFVGGGIAWFLCWILASLAHAYLNHRVYP